MYSVFRLKARLRTYSRRTSPPFSRAVTQACVPPTDQKDCGEFTTIVEPDSEDIQMRVGIIAFLHESNTFCSTATTIESFQQNTLLTGESIRESLADAHHEVGGFFAGLQEQKVEAVPLFAARALPSGTIAAESFTQLVDQLLHSVPLEDPLDGLLVAPHGATVSQEHADADGYWLQRLRQHVGHEIPIVGTLDAHANLSALMVESCDALIAYRTNPHLDQRARGIEAARLIVATIRKEVRPTMAAVLPPLAISIEKQCTQEPHLQPLYALADRQLQQSGVLTNSILLGFPYADVSEMGSAVIAVTDGSIDAADESAAALASRMWRMRDDFCGQFVSVTEALKLSKQMAGPVCLLDMGDNVGGGSSADGTELIAEIHRQQAGPSFACLFDPVAVAACEQAGTGSTIVVSAGGHTDQRHGSPLTLEVTVVSVHDGKFSEPEPRHGGISDFDQGRTAICSTAGGLTLMLTSRRMVPFSLHQLKSCGLDPAAFRILVAKGVNAPIAAYREVCAEFLRVNTIGSTCADMSKLNYHHRRRPLFPLEHDAEWDAYSADIVHGHVCHSLN